MIFTKNQKATDKISKKNEGLENLAHTESIEARRDREKRRIN